MATAVNSSTCLIPPMPLDFERSQASGKIFNSFSIENFPYQAVKENSHILFVGCGNGELVLEIAKKIISTNPHVKLTAIDIDSKQINASLEAAKQHNLEGRIQWITQDLFKLEDYKDTVDIAHARFVLNHSQQPKAALNAICTTLKSEGVFVGEELAGPEMDVYPLDPTSDYSKLMKTYEQGIVLQHYLQKSDINFGAKMEKILSKRGFQVEVKAPNILANTTEQKAIFPATMHLADQILGSYLHIAIPRIREGVTKFALDPNAAISFTNYRHVVATKI